MQQITRSIPRCLINQTKPRSIRIPTKPTHPFHPRHFSSPSSPLRRPSDWSATQYLKFNNERTQPVRDLISKIPLTTPPSQIIDLGCGPGNSTAVLAEHFPTSKITGMDSSPDMIKKAKQTLPDIEFSLADLNTYKVDPSADLLFSNAVFQWLPADQRISTLKRLLSPLQPGGILAFQVPDNFDEPSHMLMRETAKEWHSKVPGISSAALEKFQSPETLYNELSPLCSRLDIWRTHYHHVLRDHEGIVEWVKGTGLRPFLDLLEEVGDGEKERFLEGYLGRLKGVYGNLGDGRVMLRYPRLFVVAVRG